MTGHGITRRTALALGGAAAAGTAISARPAMAREATAAKAAGGTSTSLPRPQTTRLFLDMAAVASTTNISRVVQPGRKAEIVLRPDRPWEQGLDANVYMYGNVVFDEAAGIYKMWYHTYNDKISDAQYMTMYAQSSDGVQWDKPSLGVYSYNGSTDNNIIAASVGDGNARHLPSVILDPAAPASARYKMNCYTYSGSGTPWDQGYSAWTSQDGIRWVPIASEPIAPGADVITMRFDPVSGKYVSLLKIYPATNLRTVFVSYSTDFATWTDPVESLPPDSIDNALAVAAGWNHGEIYGMGASRYRDALIGFPWVMYANAGQNDGNIAAGFAVSTDTGATWDRSDRTLVIPNGPAGAFDAGLIFTASECIVCGDEVRLYYGGWPQTHANNSQAAISYASWPVDRFVALSNGGYNAGSVTTKPVTVSQPNLIVNAAIQGQLTAQLQDASGTAIPGFSFADSIPVTGDSLAHPMQWKGGSLRRLAGSSVQVSFSLSAGELYSYSL